ncbi:(d)CMP kinase [Ahrensia marina]|uniref:Cytidylate kinase n=1 Tax=Ahrensia marina TaxID=1514904 RepID=A0A0N0VLR7_9HYPH|nr:(d)CMP kinase [Ahrensia marina]KPB01861.1 cytidylate kinase [Ahrensia marina]
MDLLVAIDGPAASGKGTLSQKIAAHYGLRHLDTGLSYRAVAKALLDSGQPLDNEEIAVKVAKALDLGTMKREELAIHAVGEAASKIAVMPHVRQALVEKQREFASLAKGAVLDGRDIGTVVCPDAPVKLYVTASPEVRATRRYHEILARGNDTDEAQILADIKLRDERDMGRSDSPLKPAEDAHLLDTSKMTIEAAFEAAKSIIDAAAENN